MRNAMEGQRTDWALQETGRTGRGTTPAVWFLFRDGRKRRVKYSSIGDIEHYPASLQRYGSDMEAVGIETLERKIVVKGYNLEPLLDQLDHQAIQEVRETREKNILARKRAGEPVYVSIDIQPLLFDDTPNLPDFMKYLDRPLSPPPGRESVVMGHA